MVIAGKIQQKLRFFCLRLVGLDVVLGMRKQAYILISILAFPYVVSFFYSLKLLREKSISATIKSFVIYTSVAFIAYLLIVLLIFGIINQYDFTRINICAVLFHFTYLTYFIYSTIETKKFKVLILSIYVISSAMTINAIIEQFSSRITLTPNYYIFSLIIFCMIYYFELFKKIDNEDILKSPNFWIITGVFVGMGTSLPYQCLASIIFKVIPPQQANLIASIGTIFYSMMHIIFIKGIRCSLKIKNI